MKLSNAFTLLLLPLAALANPVPEPEVVKGEVVKGGYTPRDIIALRDEDAEVAGLVPRATVVCKIVNVVTTVSCRWNPWHAGWNGNGKSAVRTDFKPNTGHDFSCYTVGECIGGNCTWDWAPNWSCYVPGYYTDSKCTKAALGPCPWPDVPNSSPPAGLWD
ncbi:hypothetical protein VE01_03568 [Pseudogymnoascus verrucosus]|uniref:CBM1 domain-containing protein n=1 Tax=Pseudogymnoascus verrucosus TaxID=342668 RepID=A0A1B8GRW8_9PEZI|nr:uncharacterized protein VE01_03568 [Pseudogymnoascus verrucosus]OBT98571.1 hypothetical protein VE01_03568 [Pseudogymnoascus verrucosus]